MLAPTRRPSAAGPQPPARLSHVRPCAALLLGLSALMLCPHPAHAQSGAMGSYSGPAYTSPNGVCATMEGKEDPYTLLSDTPGFYGGEAVQLGGDPSNAGYIGNSGEIDTAFTWQPAQGQNTQTDPPPQCVIVTQTSEAGWDNVNYSYATVSTPVGMCDDGLKDTPTSNGPVLVNAGTAQAHMHTWGASGSDANGNGIPHYSVLPGTATGSVSCSPSSLVDSSSVPWQADVNTSAYVAYAASISPITIEPVGATSDGNGGWDILVGQQCSPTLKGIPLGCTVSGYAWTVTGTTFQKWDPTTLPTTYLDGPGPLNGPNPLSNPAIPPPSWYWNDLSYTTEKITCTATVTPPAGEGAAFQITAIRTVGVYVPTWQARGVGGKMLVGTAEVSGNGSDEYLYAAPVPGSDEPGGMTWYANVAAPSAPVTFGTGQLELVQIISPGLAYTVSNGSLYVFKGNGQTGLDTYYPYYWNGQNTPSFYTAYDEPGLDLTALMAVSASVTDSFEDYLMYEPPNSTQFVPVGYFTWDVDGNATIPSSNNWADIGQNNPVGTVNPSGTGVLFTHGNSFPSWTQNMDIYRNKFND